MPSSTPASTACEPSLAETCERVVREKIPNFFRLYLNPFVAGACYCLAEYVRKTWPAAHGDYQTFLTNSFDEALSGAVKLARYSANREGRPASGLVYDPNDRLGPFAGLTLGDGRRLEFVPDLTVATDPAGLAAALHGGKRFGFVVLVADPGQVLDGAWEAQGEQKPLVVACVSRDGPRAGGLTPDVVVFDESFAGGEVPFAAFSARAPLYRHWTRRGKSSFHSTTFQPNTLTCLHFLRCLGQADPEFHARVAPVLARLERDPAFCRVLIARLYSPFLARAIRAMGFDVPGVRAEGHHVAVGDRAVLDCVAGVACSIRGHNPAGHVAEVTARESETDTHAELEKRLAALTGLGRMLPAVSGAGAVESALRLALAAQHPRRVVVAFRGGFGGKTLFALTGTARASYKEQLDPLYRDVVYVDPFAPDVLGELERVFTAHPVAVVQLELVQAVGGVRAMPTALLEYLQANRQRHGYLLFVDEVQTGMFRTGPFTLGQRLGVRPDLLTLGKGTSDMMFPFALTLYSQELHDRLAQTAPGLTETIRERHGHDWGYRTVLSVLDHAAAVDLPRRVKESGDLLARLLREELEGCKAVRQVRAFGLLLAVELETRGWPQRLFPRGYAWACLVAMLRHQSPLLAGFCQYEPHVLKLTPPLSVTPDEVRRACATIGSVLRTPPPLLLAGALGAVAKSYL